MTKRLSIALVAVALFVLIAVMPVSAANQANGNYNGTQIDLGATVFIGEDHLNLTHALNAATTVDTAGLRPLQSRNLDNAPANLSIGWWASAAALTTSSPTKTINLLGRYNDFQVAQSDFVGYTGNWYLLNTDGTTPQKGTTVYNGGGAPLVGTPVAVFNVQDPTLSVAAWDFVQNKDVTGTSVPQGTHLGVQINTNMYAATYANRNNTKATMTWTGDAVGWTTSMGIMPDGTTSSWNRNSTDYFNCSKIETTYPGQLAANVYRITNYTRGQTIVTTGGDWATFGVNTRKQVFYWNNSVPTTTIDDNTWIAKNYTSDLNGVVHMNNVNAWDNSQPTVQTWTVVGSSAITRLIPQAAASDGFIDVKVKDESGTTFTQLMLGVQNGAPVLNATTKQFVDKQPYYLGSSAIYWVTDALDTNNQYAYPVGTYSIWAESKLNYMKDNYKNGGADYTGKTVSATGTITLVSDSVKIEANKDSVVRSKSFSVTVTGKPSSTYYMWVKGTSALNSRYDNQPPMVGLGQEGVYVDNALFANASGSTGVVTPLGTGINYHPIGDYAYDNGAGSTIYSDVAYGDIYNKTRYYCMINTSTSGTRTVEWLTNNWTKAQKYTIRVEQNFPMVGSSNYGSSYQATGSTVKSDEVDINVEKGAVTIVAAGDQSYYLGEEIKFSGTNTETYKTYLFLIGPNLPELGAKIADSDPRSAGSAAPGITNNYVPDFKAVDVNGDNTWSWKWGTASYALDAGTYTIYAVSQPYDKNHLENAAYGTVSIIIKKPFVSATASQSTVAKGDRIYITGTAEGDPSSVQIWIMGKNYATKNSASVNSDASFKYEVTQSTTQKLSSGQYFVVVQHPMQNKQYDVDTDGQYVVNKQLTTSSATGSLISSNFTRIFKLLGSGSLQGSDAAEALAEGINDANVDDTYTKLQFLVEEPVIRIDAIGDKHVGDKFTITAQTNLAVDDEILVQVYSSSFKPTQKSQSGEFSGATGTVKVTKGDSGMNLISFDVDSSTFKPDEYIVTEDAVIQTDATGTALFNVLETSATTVAPTSVATAVQTSVVTSAPTQVATPVPTATTKPSPGYGALIALIGLGAVAFIVVRRH